jgi:hypothetical protein
MALLGEFLTNLTVVRDLFIQDGKTYPCKRRGIGVKAWFLLKHELSDLLASLRWYMLYKTRFIPMKGTGRQG